MPVTTVNSDGTTVTVTVTNSQPSGNKHSVGAYLCWDPDYLEMENPDPVDAKLYNSYGFCVWYGYKIDVYKKKPFKLTFKSVKKTGKTWLVACSMDPVLGIFSNPKRKRVTVTKTVRRKTRKKS